VGSDLLWRRRPEATKNVQAPKLIAIISIRDLFISVPHLGSPSNAATAIQYMYSSHASGLQDLPSFKEPIRNHFVSVQTPCRVAVKDITLSRIHLPEDLVKKARLVAVYLNRGAQVMVDRVPWCGIFIPFPHWSISG
jgi:hypothetical protein